MSSGFYKFYRDRPEWSDITPLKQDESPRNVVRIAYSEMFADAHDYIRAVMAVDERSPRALELTAEALQMNAANYSVWAYRRNLLLSLGTSLKSERRFVKTMLYEHPKNYQLWFHLQWLVEQLTKDEDPKTVYDRQDSPSFEILERELDLILEILSDDAKNYHAWQYRRWLVEYFAVPNKNELDFTTMMLSSDALNNSAWNHRFYTIVKEEITESVFDREFEYVGNFIHSAPHNESACNYLLGLLSPLPKFSRDGKDMSMLTMENEKSADRLLRIRELVEDAVSQDISGAADSPVLLSLLVEILSRDLELHITANQVLSSTAGVGDGENPEDLRQRILEICERLATELDRVRVNYWQYRSNQIKQIAAHQTSVPLASK